MVGYACVIFSCFSKIIEHMFPGVTTALGIGWFACEGGILDCPHEWDGSGVVLLLVLQRPNPTAVWHLSCVVVLCCFALYGVSLGFGAGRGCLCCCVLCCSILHCAVLHCTVLRGMALR